MRKRDPKGLEVKLLSRVQLLATAWAVACPDAKEASWLHLKHLGHPQHQGMAFERF